MPRVAKKEYAFLPKGIQKPILVKWTAEAFSGAVIVLFAQYGMSILDHFRIEVKIRRKFQEVILHDLLEFIQENIIEWIPLSGDPELYYKGEKSKKREGTLTFPDAVHVQFSTEDFLDGMNWSLSLFPQPKPFSQVFRENGTYTPSRRLGPSEQRVERSKRLTQGIRSIRRTAKAVRASLKGDFIRQRAEQRLVQKRDVLVGKRRPIRSIYAP